MMCYKDKTFCVTKCNTECTRKLTEQIKKDAEEFGLGIACADFNCKEKT